LIGKKGVFYNLIAKEEARATAHQSGPEPLSALTTPLRVTGERFGRVPRAYIEARHDRAISLDMQAALPCKPMIMLEADHSPFYSAAPELTQVLLNLAGAAK
jgi:hypothetical protein